MESFEAKVVKSLLNGDNHELFNFIPYLLQDLWEIGSLPEVMIDMVKSHISNHNINILDLGCGKGAVSIKLAKSVGGNVKGIDAIKGFIDYARNKAEQFGVNNICIFEVGDIRACFEENYDLVIFSACGDVLGDLDVAIIKLKGMVRNGGFIIIDDASCEDDKKIDGYLTHEETINIFTKNKVKLIQEYIIADETLADINDTNNQNIIQRAQELKEKYPDKSKIFDDYVRKQLDECEVSDNKIKCVTWLLKKLD